ncbi:ORF6N domain-containing protein [Acidovorax sp. Root217]|uniref:ORF6N domain-containing protein n=1 Tax=Acidovorax sp. Root217 TaxID=1736492 RepID=UPI00070DF4ED|nr:ORF6N domain-containing protein [Acidovorax sp. Root217]KRC30661.1 hypothetical protein ASE31_00285 [Acidovorax sp. Root217]
MNNAVTIAGIPSTRIAYRDRTVCTTQQLAQFYGCADRNLTDNQQRNAERFEEGKHFFKIEGEELRAFKAHYPADSGVVAERAPHLILWTDKGAARHAKMLTTDKAWEVFEEMEERYFEAPAKMKPARVRGRTPLEQVKIINFVGDSLKAVPGVRLGMVAAAKLKAFQEHTGIDFSEFRRALPPVALEHMVHLNPTEIGARVAEQTGRAKVSSQAVNKVLIALGLQRQAESGYVLTEAGSKYGEAHDFRATNDHGGIQIDWWESVVDVVRDNLPAEKPKRAAPAPAPAPEPQGALL